MVVDCRPKGEKSCNQHLVRPPPKPPPKEDTGPWFDIAEGEVQVWGTGGVVVWAYL